jgi:hypothetical protein
VHAAAEYGDDVFETDSEQDDEKQQYKDMLQTRQNFSWALARLQPPAAAHCWQCQQAVAHPVRCTTCDPCGALLCPDCDRQCHSTAHFHRREHFLQGYSEPLGHSSFIVGKDQHGVGPDAPVIQSVYCAELLAGLPLTVGGLLSSNESGIVLPELHACAAAMTCCCPLQCWRLVTHLCCMLCAAQRLSFHVMPLTPCACGAKDCWQLLPSSEEDPDLIVVSLTGAGQWCCGVQSIVPR